MRRMLLGLPMLLALALPAAAETVAETVAEQLRDQGYERIETSQTWLGRLRVNAVQGEMRREIVINPNTGEILRDYEMLIPRHAQREDRGGSGADTAASTAARAESATADVVDLVEPGTTLGDAPDTGTARE